MTMRIATGSLMAFSAGCLLLATCGGGNENPTVCGDLVRQGPEVCDGRDFGGKTCRDFGFADGLLACTDLCQADTSACSQTIFDDCRHIESSCYAPFGCILDTQTEEYYCSTPVNDIPTCSGSPADLTVPLTTAYNTNKTLHWTLAEGCIPVTYEPGLASLAGLISSAVEAFNATTCSRLCFGPPQSSAIEPDLDRRERRLHIHQNSEQYDVALTNNFFEWTSGRMIASVIEIKPDYMNQLDQASMLYLFGLACGLAPVAGGTDSVMTNPVDPGHTTLSPADEQSLCRLYGDPSYCGE